MNSKIIQRTFFITALLQIHRTESLRQAILCPNFFFFFPQKEGEKLTSDLTEVVQL